MYSHSAPRISEFVVEIYAPRDTAKRAAARVEDAALAADQVSAQTAEVRVVRAISVRRTRPASTSTRQRRPTPSVRQRGPAHLRLVRISEAVSMRPQGDRR